jgi:hypothetical protein
VTPPGRPAAPGGDRPIDELIDAIQRAGATIFARNAHRLINM